MRTRTIDRRLACSIFAIILVAALLAAENVAILYAASSGRAALWAISLMAMIVVVACGVLRLANSRKQVDQELRAIIETSREWIWSIDISGRHTFSNPAIEVILGYRPDEIVGKSSLDLVHREDRAKIEGRLPEWIADKRGWSNLLLRWRHKDGGYRYLESNAVPILDRSGGVVGFRGVDRDITRLKRSEEHAQVLLSTIADAVFVHDAEGVLHEVNDAACEMFGRTEEELVGMRVSDLWIDSDRANLARIWATMTAPVTIAGRHRRDDGSEFPVEVRVARGTGDMFVATVRDTSDREETERQLRDAVLKADAANVAKSEFLANMSHEIRTPLTAILGFAEMLELDGDLESAPPSRLSAIDTIRRNGDHLLRIINDILDLSKIEAGRLHISTEPCNLRSIVDGTVASFRNLPSTQTELVSECPEVMIEASAVRLRQILLNLVGNAVKFTEEGIVKVTATVEQGQLSIEIDDDGPGMSPEQAAGLFASFHQLDNSATRKHGGAGLGLTISRRLARAMGGDVEIVRANPGEGCTFRMTLPTPILAARSDDNGAPNLPSGLRVLVVEDKPDNQRLITGLLEHFGNKVDVADNGEQGVDRILAGHEYDVILMDMQMPVMDGYTATRLLREAGYDCPIVAVTAHALEGDIEKCLGAGCDAYTPKPVSSATLSAAIAQVLSMSLRLT